MFERWREVTNSANRNHSKGNEKNKHFKLVLYSVMKITLSSIAIVLKKAPFFHWCTCQVVVALSVSQPYSKL